MTRSRERAFTGDPNSPAAARAFAKAALGDLLRIPVPQLLCDDLELVVSELVTNAVRAGSRTVSVVVETGAGTVVVRVTDDASGWPEARVAGPEDTTGRGLPLVSAVSQSWGVRLARSGKVVWAELAVPAAAGPAA